MISIKCAQTRYQSKSKCESHVCYDLYYVSLNFIIFEHCNVSGSCFINYPRFSCTWVWCTVLPLVSYYTQVRYQSYIAPRTI